MLSDKNGNRIRLFGPLFGVTKIPGHVDRYSFRMHLMWAVLIRDSGKCSLLAIVVFIAVLVVTGLLGIIFHSALVSHTLPDNFLRILAICITCTFLAWFLCYSKYYKGIAEEVVWVMLDHEICPGCLHSLKYNKRVDCITENDNQDNDGRGDVNNNSHSAAVTRGKSHKQKNVRCTECGINWVDENVPAYMIK